MTKTDDDFFVPDDPKPAPPKRTMPMADWEYLIELIDEMIDSEEFNWALPTLEGIREYVECCKKFTFKQAKAIRNIAQSKGWNVSDRPPYCSVAAREAHLVE